MGGPGRRGQAPPWRLLAAAARDLATQIRAGLSICGDCPGHALRARYAAATAMVVSLDRWADLCAQAVVVLRGSVQFAPKMLREAAVQRWLLAQADPLWRDLLACAQEPTCRGGAPLLWNSLRLDAGLLRTVDDAVGELIERDGRSTTGASVDRGLRVTHFYEQFLAAYSRQQRSRWGVYYTPREIVRFMVSFVDRLLEGDFGLPGGMLTAGDMNALAERPGLACRPPRFVDPAAGTGAFLVEILRHTHEQLMSRCRRDGVTPSERDKRWRRCVPGLVSRLAGCEILLPACAVAQINLAVQLAETGWNFDAPLPLSVVCGDALQGPRATWPPLAQAAEQKTADHAILVVLGNPPFSGFSHNNGPWIADLLRGQGEGDAGRRDYTRVNGQPLKERKVWWNDDYIKFFRYAQWRIEDHGEGILAFVSNHGFLDNATLRGMRNHLLETFPRMWVVDLHGNIKRGEQAPDGTRDENLFGIEQGVAVTIGLRSDQRREKTIRRADLWGSIGCKSAALRALLAANAPDDSAGTPRGPFRDCHPQPPFHWLSPVQARLPAGLPSGWSLAEAMPIGGTVPVTARDGLVIDFEREGLRTRMREFGDLSLSDDEVRGRYCSRSRSSRYPPGDTRGWKLPVARARMAEVADLNAYVRRCLYRPFDWRYIFWTDWMVDWPRPGLWEQLELSPGFSLLTRRQMLPDQPCSFFWVADCLAIDGVLRSDNRGTESVFPVFVQREGRREPNFHAGLIEQFLRAVELPWRPELSNHLRAGFGAADLAAYMYALFYGSAYRQAYAAWLRADFPRVLIPRSRDIFERLTAIGRRLLTLHLGQGVCTSPIAVVFEPGGDEATGVEPGYPRFRDGVVQVSRKACFRGIAPEIWQWRAGAHQVCRKWLADRRGRALSDLEIRAYQQVVAAIGQTLANIARIDRLIADAGGLAAVFLRSP